MAGPRDLDIGHGIHAAVYDEARAYYGAIHLVAPYPGTELVLAEKGWRASAAICVAPANKSAEQTQAAKTILASKRAGYPQIGDVVGWAHYTIYDVDGLIQCGEPRWLYFAGLSWPHYRWSTRITQALCALPPANFYWLYQAGHNWPNERWSPEMARAIARDPFWASQAREYWPECRARACG